MQSRKKRHGKTDSEGVGGKEGKNWKTPTMKGEEKKGKGTDPLFSRTTSGKVHTVMGQVTGRMPKATATLEALRLSRSAAGVLLLKYQGASTMYPHHSENNACNSPGLTSIEANYSREGWPSSFRAGGYRDPTHSQEPMAKMPPLCSSISPTPHQAHTWATLPLGSKGYQLVLVSF